MKNTTASSLLIVKVYKVIISFLIFYNFTMCGINRNIIDSSRNQSKLERPSTFIATHLDYLTYSTPSKPVVLGYIIDGFKPSDSQLKKMTHIAISFLRPSSDKGAISMTPGWDNIDEVVTAAHNNNVKVLISFGGGDFKITSELMGVKENRENLIKNILYFMKKHNIDGFDCDWEPSWIDDKKEMEAINNTITHYYITFIKEFREHLDNEFGKGSKTFTAAVLNKNEIWYSNKKKIAHFPQNGWWHYLDWIALMNYDNDLGSKHATFETVFGDKGSVAHWTKFGIPKEKIITGIPFYARAGWGEEWLSYKHIIEINPVIADSIDFIIYNKNDSGSKAYGFNGKLTTRKKVAKNKELGLLGIMFWQLAGDLPVDHEKSLLKAICEELN
tara:strand:+ start:289 stop:1449 length:1161 start_codon:yes stop_codon:yes gene_type:complete